MLHDNQLPIINNQFIQARNSPMIPQAQKPIDWKQFKKFNVGEKPKPKTYATLTDFMQSPDAKSGSIQYRGGKSDVPGLFDMAKNIGKKVVDKLSGSSFEVNNTKALISDGIKAAPSAWQYGDELNDAAINFFEDAIVGHESRGVTGNPSTTVNPVTGATGSSQLTEVAFNEWQRNYAKDKKLAKGLTWQQVQKSSDYQNLVTRESIAGILNKKPQMDWPTGTQKLKQYKQEILANFNDPISRLAGEWVAGPNWVAKLDNTTAPGAKETVRDYINSVKERYYNSLAIGSI